jgi:UDP-N-acetylmuramate dehydrogenase
MNQTFYNELRQENPGLEILLEEPMKNHTTFHIGGPAEYFAEPDEQQLISICRLTAAHGIPLTIIGNGSNLLVRDAGIRGMVVAIAKNMSEIQIQDEQRSQPETVTLSAGQPQQPVTTPDGKTLAQAGQHTARQPVHIYAGAGAMLSKVANTAARMWLTGMEFAAGIPGSIGGAVVMNAGAYGGEIKDILVSVRVLVPDGTVRTVPATGDAIATPDGSPRTVPASELACSDITGPACSGTTGSAQPADIRTLPASALDLSYRHSNIPEQGCIVLGAEFALQAGDPETITQTMADLRASRIDKQPLEYYSAGSTFKRPEGYFAGKLIMDAGLRGYSVGDAQVSEKHCGFVVNRGSATAAEVLQLVADVREKVRGLFGVELEPEIKIIGE